MAEDRPKPGRGWVSPDWGSTASTEGGVEGGIGIALSIGGYSAKASLYPPVPGEGYDVRYERYWGEPPLDQLGDAGQLMRRLIAIIARMLDIPSDTQYAAGFTIAAARIVAERAQQVTRYSMDDRVEGLMLEATSIGAVDKKGQFYFKPVPSVASQYLQHLARVIPLIRQLTELVLVHIGRRPDTAFTWGYHFFEQVAENAFNSCKHLFIYACQISLLQYLRTTRNHISKRRANLDNYVKTFAVLVETMLADHTELVLLRNALDKHVSGTGGATGEEAYEEAAESAKFSALVNDTYEVLEQKLHERDLMLELTDPSDFVQRRGEKAGELHAGEIACRGDAWTIRDSKGKEWTTRGDGPRHGPQAQVHRVDRSAGHAGVELPGPDPPAGGRPDEDQGLRRVAPRRDGDEEPVGDEKGRGRVPGTRSSMASFARRTRTTRQRRGTRAGSCRESTRWPTACSAAPSPSTRSTSAPSTA